MFGGTLAATAIVSHAASARQAAETEPPSIVLILTDDQRWDTLAAMPNVRDLLIAHGVDFKKGFVVNPVCCPSRASILTGNYSHTTGIYTNAYPNGGFQKFQASGDDKSTIATWLHDAGYHTALFGKYLNEYGEYSLHGTYIPPGWDRWFAFDENGGGTYFRYWITDNGTLRWHGEGQQDYSTDVLARRAAGFIQETQGPLFVYFATSAPHGPATPKPRDASKFSDLRPWRPPDYNESDVGDKPTWVQDRHRLGPWGQRDIDRLRIDQYRTLLPIDRAVGRIVGALQATGRLDNTMIVFASDNGFFWGEHRLRGKLPPYEEGIRIPFVVRYDPLTSTPRVDSSHLVLNIDLAPTFAELAGADHPSTEGSSLLPLLTDPDAAWRSDFLIEHLEAKQGIPTYCAVRNERYIYVDYQDDSGLHEFELYDLAADPYEMVNRAADPDYAAIRAQLSVRLKELCTPPPPGYVPSP